MKTPQILIPIYRAEYEIFVVAARILRKAQGLSAPDAITLIQFQLAHRTATGLAKEYLDCIGDFAGRRDIRPKTMRESARQAKPGGRRGVLRSVPSPKDSSRN